MLRSTFYINVRRPPARPADNVIVVALNKKKPCPGLVTTGSRHNANETAPIAFGSVPINYCDTTTTPIT